MMIRAFVFRFRLLKRAPNHLSLRLSFYILLRPPFILSTLLIARPYPSPFGHDELPSTGRAMSSATSFSPSANVLF